MAERFPIAFSRGGCALFLERLSQARVVFEYGSGGTTLAAASSPARRVVAVESDPEWRDAVLARARQMRIADRVVLLFADIGFVAEGRLGAPRDDSAWRRFPDYPLAPWRYARRHGLDPDLVVIDGRFRVASLLATCVSIRRETSVLFDDFPHRPNYRVIDEFLEPAALMDDRLALFELEPGMVTAERLLQHVDKFYRPWH